MSVKLYLLASETSRGCWITDRAVDISSTETSYQHRIEKPRLVEHRRPESWARRSCRPLWWASKFVVYWFVQNLPNIATVTNKNAASHLIKPPKNQNARPTPFIIIRLMSRVRLLHYRESLQGFCKTKLFIFTRRARESLTSSLLPTHRQTWEPSRKYRKFNLPFPSTILGP